MKSLKFKKGFTLAEVLIVLGIVGVVAALTIPTLIANIRGARYRTQFKKTLSTLNQAVLMNKAQYDWDFADAAPCMNYISEHDVSPQTTMNMCSIFNGALTGHSWMLFTPSTDINDKDYVILSSNTSSSAIGSALEHEDLAVITLSDGSAFAFQGGTFGCALAPGEKLTEMKSKDQDSFPIFEYCIGYIDVNGPDLPNKEVECSNGVETVLDPSTTCVVKDSEMTDIFPVVFHDSTIEPASNASAYVLRTTK